MEKALQRIKPKYFWIVAFLLGGLSMFFMLTYSQMLTSGKYVIIGGDAWDIYISNIRMLIRTIKDGGNIWYSFATSMGYNTSLTVAFELMSPFNILFVLFDKADPNVILAIIIIGKVGTAAAAFQLFSRKVLGNEKISSVIFAVFYAMCAFTVEYCIANFMWLDGIYMLPIVAWATYVAVKKNKYIFLTLSYAYIFIVQFYMGYLLAGFSLIYFILLLCTQKKEERPTKTIFAIARYVLSALTAIALSAFLWVPVVTFLVNHTVSDSTQFTSIGVNPLEVLNNLFWGEFQDYHTYPYIYCGLPALILLPFFFFNRKIAVREKTLYGILFLFFVLGCMVLPIYKLLHGFDAPDMWNFRFSFIISFLICAMACKQSEYLEEVKNKHFFFFALGLMALYVLEMFLQPRKIGWVARNTQIGLLINFLAIAAWFGMTRLFYHVKDKKLTVVLGLIMMTIVEVVTNGCVRTFDSVWKQGLTKEDYYYCWEEENGRNLAEIAKANAGMDENDFYRLCIFGDAVYNSDAYFGYNGVSDFNSAENESLREFMGNMGFYTTTRRTSGTGLTPPMEMLLSVKDTSRLYIDISMMGIEPDTKVYENEYYLPLGFMVNDEAAKDLTYTSNVFENQNNLINALSGVDGVYEEIPAENITQESTGIWYSEEDTTFYITEDEGMETSFLVSGTLDPTYVQIDASVLDGSVSGLSYGVFMNQLSSLDYNLSVPFAAEMAQFDYNHKIILGATEEFGGCRVNGVYIYKLSSEKMGEAHEALAGETMLIDELKNGHVKGVIKTSGEKTLMFTSIPYTDGWSLTVDDEEQEIEPVINGTFCGIRIPEAGVHEIELTYHCPGGLLGGYISFTGIFMLSLVIILEGFSLRKRASKED
jgi:uncharacterized membrane protein YfhO